MIKKSDNIKVIFLGVIISLIAFSFTFKYEIEKEKLHLNTSANNFFNKIENIFSTIEQANKELSSRFYLPDEINQDDFKFFTSTLIQQNNFIQNIIFAKNIKSKDKSNYEENLRYMGYTGFKIEPFNKKTVPLTNPPKFLLPIKYIEPYTVKNSHFFGLDLYTHPIISTIFTDATLNKLQYTSGNKNIFYATNLLYRGYIEPTDTKSLSDLYGVLLYEIQLENLNNYYYLNLTVNGKTILNKKRTHNDYYEITSYYNKETLINKQKIKIRLEQKKSIFSISVAYPTIVLLLALSLTWLIWSMFNSNEKINNLLYKQKKIVEDEVNVKTEELRKKADELSITLQQQVALTDELEAFSYSVSHDLRAPLHSIDGFNELLQVSYSNTLDQNANDYLNHIDKASKKMNHIINDLLSLAHVSRSNIKTKKCNLSEIAERSIDSIRDYDPHRKVTVKIEKNIFANVDANFMEICFDNILNNAWKYSRKTDNPCIEFAQFKKEDESIYYIRDNGVGFDMHDTSKLFAAFQRLHKDSEFEGTGIGLMTAQRIIQKHNGRIWAESVQGEGATFFFTLNTD